MTVETGSIAEVKKTRIGGKRPFYLKLLLVALGLAALGFSIRFGWRCLINLDTFKVKPGTFSFDLPSWVKAGLLDEIKKTTIMEEAHSIFERDLTKKIAEVFSENHWVAKVHYVKKDFPDKIKIKFSLRKPFAVVKKEGSFYLLDNECIRLPEKFYYWPDGNPEALFIQSNKLSKSPAYWEKWDDAGIHAGVKLVGFLKKNKVHKLLNVTTIDVSNVNAKNGSAESDIVLVTKNGTQIKWGRSSTSGGCKTHGEPSDTEKLQNLLSVAKAEGRNLRRIEYVDVRWDMPQGKLR